MKKILVMAHHPETGHLKMRLVEIAKRLAEENDIYLVRWSSAYREHTLAERIGSSLADLLRNMRTTKEGRLNIVEFPMLHRPLAGVPPFNSYWLMKYIEREKIDAVINGSYYMFSIPERWQFRYIVDIADAPVSGDGGYFDRFITRILAGEIKKADHVTVSSMGLADHISERYACSPKFIPNGADIRKIRSVETWKIEAARKSCGLEGKWVIGYIGYMGAWVDMKTMTSAFAQLKNRYPDAAMMWIGSAPGISRIQREYSSDGVVFTGGIKEIEPYFHLLDVALMPTKRSLFQGLAFHIKLIEYTAARKIVVSSPLEEVRRTGLPNVILADLKREDWVDAIARARGMKWDPAWDGLVNGYDWENIAGRFVDLIER